MARPWEMLKLLEEAASHKANHPRAWDGGIGAANSYYELAIKMLRTYDLSNQQAIAMVYATVPTTPDAVGRCVQFAMNERLPPMLKAMMADGAFKTLGFEPTEAALAAMSVSFAIALDGLFNEYVRFLLLAQQGKIVTEPPRGYAKLNTEVPKSSGCVILLGILLAVLTFLATFH